MLEVGKRNASADAERIKKIKDLCDQLLSSENAEESRVEEAIKECDACMAKIKEVEVTKTKSELALYLGVKNLFNFSDI